ncbi:MAG TPA: energy transducer TonB [Hellea balneolensis]|uniref:Protein TonB n=1 Tax=Hellea balneolensis TaxID=287478 RepID=A0A7C3GCW2_9PROT|nr:energy transducer TonB [Hellea balneolensis]
MNHSLKWKLTGVSLGLMFVLSACSSTKPFNPRSDYPLDPWVKGYANPDDCLGGEKLAAVSFDLPTYPKGAFKKGQQGWVIVRLDVNAQGETEHVRVERALPAKRFADNAKKAVRKWKFQPPQGGGLQNCRVLIRYRLGGVSLGS